MEKDFFKDLVFVTTVKENKGLLRFCRTCRVVRVSFPDIYFDGRPEENLKNDPVTGKPPVFVSKGQKAAYLKERGIMEAGDSVHGAPVEAFRNQEPKAVDSRAQVREALRQVKEMGRDVRRQEYLKIIKEGRDARS